MSNADEVIYDPELGEIPVIFETDSKEEKERKQKIIDQKLDSVISEE
jgi:hypothetical protein